MRVLKYNDSVEFRVQFPTSITGLAGNQITLNLFRAVNSVANSLTDTSISMTFNTTTGGNFDFYEVSSTGIYRIHVPASVFTNIANPSSVNSPVLYYGKVSNSQDNSVVTIPMFEIAQLGEDDRNQHLIEIEADLNGNISSEFAGTTVSVNSQPLAQVLRAIWDDTNAQVAGSDWDQVLSTSSHHQTFSAGQRLYNLSEAWETGGSLQVVLDSLFTKTGSSSDSGTSTIYGLLNNILTDSGTSLPALIGTSAVGGGDISADLNLMHARVGAPAGGTSISDDIATSQTNVRADVATLKTDVQADIANLDGDVVAVKADTANVLTKIGTSSITSSLAGDLVAINNRIGVPTGSNISADLVSIQADTDDLQVKIGTPSVDLATDATQNFNSLKGDSTSLLSRIGTISSNASLGGDLFGAIKYIANQTQISQASLQAPARADIHFPPMILAPQGVSDKYLKIKVFNRNNQYQLERPRALGDNGTQVNGEFRFTSQTLSASVSGAQLVITVNGYTETWTFYDIQSNSGFTTGLDSSSATSGTGKFVYNSTDSANANDWFRSYGLPVLQQQSKVKAVFEFSDPNSDSLLVCPFNYDHAVTLAFNGGAGNATFVQSASSSTAVSGVGQMFMRVLVDGVASTDRFYQDANGNTQAKPSTASNSTNDGSIGQPSPATDYFAMIGEEGAGQFFLYYQVSAGQNENLTFEIYGLDKNKIGDSLGSDVPSDSIESKIVAVFHTQVQTQSLANMGVAF